MPMLPSVLMPSKMSVDVRTSIEQAESPLDIGHFKAAGSSRSAEPRGAGRFAAHLCGAKMANVGMELESNKDRTYELKKRLGRGSFASVWKAEDTREHTLSAIKVFELHDALATIEELKKAFGREREVLSEIRHLGCPHLVRMTESFEDEATGLYCIVMTLVEGSSLQDRM